MRVRVRVRVGVGVRVRVRVRARVRARARVRVRVRVRVRDRVRARVRVSTAAFDERRSTRSRMALRLLSSATDDAALGRTTPQKGGRCIRSSSRSRTCNRT